MGDKDHKLTLYETARFALRPIKAIWSDKSMFLDVLEKAGRFDADRISFSLGSNYHILLKDPEDIRKVLTAPASQMGHSRYQAKPVSVSDCKIVTNSDGEDWKQQRKNIAKFMGTRGMKLGFQEEAQGFIADYVAQWKDKPKIHVAEEASRLSLKYMFKASFDHELSDDDCDVLHRTADEMHNYLYWSVVNRGILPKSVVKSLTGVDKATRTYNDIADQLLKSYDRMEPEDQKKHFFASLFHDENGQGHGDVDPEQVRASIREMMVAAHFSVRTSFYWALHNIARNPDIQDQIREESATLDRVPIVKPGADMSLPMSMKATMETLRMRPPFYIFLKETKCEFDKLDGLTLPEGATVIIPPWLVHHNPDLYPNPNEFDPDTNFAPSELASRSRFAFLPFGHGPHNCPGSGLTLQQMSSTLTEICQNYTLAPVDGEDLPRVHADVFLKPENDSMLEITPI